MKTIKITNQSEWDKLPDSFKEETEIIITGEIYEITHKDMALFCVCEKAKIQRVRDSATIQSVWGSATIQRVGDSATIQSVRGSATIQRVGGNANIKIYSSSASIKKAIQECVIICQDCNPKIPEDAPNVIRTKNALHDIKSFTSFYDDLVKGKTMTLYKSVNPDTECDFYTGKICYKDGATIKPTTFDPDPKRECGDGLHLSPTPEMALSYNTGKIKVCEVAIKDIVVHKHNITKVRCAKVKVIGDYKP